MDANIILPCQVKSVFRAYIILRTIHGKDLLNPVKEAVNENEADHSL
jgi:hypothetical protein